MGPEATWTSTTPSFHVPPGLSGTPGTPAPPGLAPSVSMSALLAVTDSSSSAVMRPNLPTVSAPSIPDVQQQMYPTYPSLPAMAASPQGLWVQPPQIGGMPRPPFLQYPTVYPGPFHSSARNVSLPSVLSPDSQPPGVTSMGTGGAIPMSSAAPDHQLVGAMGMQTESPPPGIGTLRVSS